MSVEQFDGKFYRAKIEYDDDPQNPREEWDHACTMVCFHRRYNLGDKHDFADPESFDEWREEHEDEIAAILPLYLYDHSGITMSTGRFSCPWDSGQVGYIYLTKEAFKECQLKKWTGCKKHVEIAERILKSEVEEYDQYISGQVYLFDIFELVEDQDGDQIEGEDAVDSCCGFFGLDHCIEEAKAALKHLEESRAKSLEYQI